MQPAPNQEHCDYLAKFPYATRDEWDLYSEHLCGRLRRMIKRRGPKGDDVGDLVQQCFMYLYNRWKKGGLRVESGIARHSVESSGSRVTHSTMPFSV